MTEQVGEVNGGSAHAVPFGYFGGVITCGDGRIQETIQKYMRWKYAVCVCDVATEPGLDGRLEVYSDELKRQYDVYNGAHNHAIRAIAGHRKCAGNQVDREQHKRDIERAVSMVMAWGDGVPTVGLLVGPMSENLYGEWMVVETYEPTTGEWWEC